MKNISILGSTGSIGVSSLDVIIKNSSDYNVLALSAGKNLRLLKEQIATFRPKIVSVLDQCCADELTEMLGRSHRETKVLWGIEGYAEVAALDGVDMVISAIVGAAGLLPTIEAIEAGKDIALANKETMVMAGRLVVEKARTKGVSILPVDSEHSAIFQCLEGHGKKDVKRIILTASGGPFFNLPREILKDVSLEETLKHPNWEMGRKITIDSASMMNKGLEVIEARWLFDVEVENIDVIIHPQSIIHSMVEYNDGAIIAQLGIPDMRGPIAYALSYPDRHMGVISPLDLVETGKLEFYAPDLEKFKNLALAYRAAKTGGTAPAVLNAVNEVAVDAYIEGNIGFLDMPMIVERVLDRHTSSEPHTVEDVLSADRWARNTARKTVQNMEENR